MKSKNLILINLAGLFLAGSLTSVFADSAQDACNSIGATAVRTDTGMQSCPQEMNTLCLKKTYGGGPIEGSCSVSYYPQDSSGPADTVAACYPDTVGIGPNSPIFKYVLCETESRHHSNYKWAVLVGTNYTPASYNN